MMNKSMTFFGISMFGLSALFAVNSVTAQPNHQASIQKSTHQTQRLAVMMAESGRVEKTAEGYQLVLTNLNPRVVWFADRPQRLAGFVPVKTFLINWPHYFKDNPPNAALGDLLTEAKNNTEQEIAVELLNPKAVGNAVVFEIRPLGHGKIKPKILKFPTLFIDSFWSTISGGASSAWNSVSSGASSAWHDVTSGNLPGGGSVLSGIQGGLGSVMSLGGGLPGVSSIAGLSGFSSGGTVEASPNNHCAESLSQSSAYKTYGCKLIQGKYSYSNGSCRIQGLSCNSHITYNGHSLTGANGIPAIFYSGGSMSTENLSLSAVAGLRVTNAYQENNGDYFLVLN